MPLRSAAALLCRNSLRPLVAAQLQQLRAKPPVAPSNGLCTLVDRGPSAQQLLHREFVPSTTRGFSTAVRQQADEEELRAYFPNLTEADWAKIKGGHTWGSVAGNNIYHNLFKRRLEPLKEYLGLSHAELEKIVLRFPTVHDNNNLVHEKLEPLQAFLDLAAAELKKTVLLATNVLSCTHDNLVKDKLKPLQALLDLNAAELKKIVLGLPPVLGLSYEDNVKPTLAQLQEHLDLDAAELKKIVLGLPAVLGCSYEDNIKPTLVQLQEHLNLDAVELKKIVLLKPAVLSYVTANVVTKLRHQ
jgi:mTERF domain-containing protein